MRRSERAVEAAVLRVSSAWLKTHPQEALALGPPAAELDLASSNFGAVLRGCSK